MLLLLLFLVRWGRSRFGGAFVEEVVKALVGFVEVVEFKMMVSKLWDLVREWIVCVKVERRLWAEWILVSFSRLRDHVRKGFKMN